MEHGGEADNLKGVDGNLALGHTEDFLVVEYLDVSLRYGHADVIACLLQIDGGSLEVQTAQLDVVFDGEAFEDGHLGADAE